MRRACRACARYPGKDEYIFTSPEGGPLHRYNFYRRVWKPALVAAGLEGLRIHDLRHTAASVAINAGAPVKQVQQMLGHSSATVTLDTYSHIFPSLSDQLREGLERAFSEANADLSRTKSETQLIPLAEKKSEFAG